MKKHCLYCLFLALLSFPLCAQWTLLVNFGAYKGNGLTAIGNVLIATGQGGKILTSTNNGTTWALFNTGLATSNNYSETNDTHNNISSPKQGFRPRHSSAWRVFGCSCATPLQTRMLLGSI